MGGPKRREETTETKSLIPLKSPQEALALLGQGDQYLKYLKKLLPAQILVRGNEIQLLGTPEAVQLSEQVLRDLLTLVRQGADLDEATLEQAVMSAQGGGSMVQESSSALLGELALPGRLKPKTPGQKRYVEAISQSDITFGVGPAGTGKTYLAVAMAVAFLKAKRIKRIILTRPAVEAGERLGFLPGDLQAKIDPYLRPLYDALFDMIDAERFEQYLQAGVIEVAPLAFMRGRTLNDAFIILDEAQNTTPEQMKMFLTRMGFNSRVVITGDVTQIDLPKAQKSGLVEAMRILKDIQGIAMLYFRESDVVRHPLVARIVKAYENSEAASQYSDGVSRNEDHARQG